jgi:DedD protein
VSAAAAPRRRAGRALGWTLFASALVVGAGFALGVLVGAGFEAPGLFFGSAEAGATDVPWSEEGGAPSRPGPAALPAVEAAPPPFGEEGEAEPERSPEPVTRGLPRARPTRAAPPAVAAAPPAAGFSVQVGAFADSRAASELADRLRKQKLAAYVSPGAGAGDARWRVRVGPLASREEAEALAERLGSQSLTGWVVEEDSR